MHKCWENLPTPFLLNISFCFHPFPPPPSCLAYRALRALFTVHHALHVNVSTFLLPCLQHDSSLALPLFLLLKTFSFFFLLFYNSFIIIHMSKKANWCSCCSSFCHVIHSPLEGTAVHYHRLCICVSVWRDSRERPMIKYEWGVSCLSEQKQTHQEVWRLCLEYEYCFFTPQRAEVGV